MRYIYLAAQKIGDAGARGINASENWLNRASRRGRDGRDRRNYWFGRLNLRRRSNRVVYAARRSLRSIRFCNSENLRFARYSLPSCVLKRDLDGLLSGARRPICRCHHGLAGLKRYRHGAERAPALLETNRAAKRAGRGVEYARVNGDPLASDRCFGRKKNRLCRESGRRLRRSDKRYQENE